MREPGRGDRIDEFGSLRTGSVAKPASRLLQPSTLRRGVEGWAEFGARPQMPTVFPHPLSRRSAELPAAWRPGRGRRAAMAEVARARLHAAALHGDPLAAEAAARAYAIAVNLALLDELARASGAMLRLAWRTVRGRRAVVASVRELDP